MTATTTKAIEELASAITATGESFSTHLRVSKLAVQDCDTFCGWSIPPGLASQAGLTDVSDDPRWSRSREQHFRDRRDHYWIVSSDGGRVAFLDYVGDLEQMAIRYARPVKWRWNDGTEHEA